MHPLSANIDALHRRLVWRERALSACLILAAILAAVCVLGVADYFVRVADRGLRVMISASLAAVVAWACYRWWWVPRRKRPTPLTVARQIEGRFPQLRDRLASAMEFLGQSEDDPTAGSAALRRAVVADADLAVSELPIGDVIDHRPLRQATIAAACVAAFLALCIFINPSAVSTAMIRLVAPWGNTEWPRTNHLAFRNPPTRIAAGQTFEVELVDRDGQLPENVRIEYRLPHEGRIQIQSEWMHRVGDVMVARRGDVGESFAFRAEGGDDLTMPWHHVEVIEPPQLESVSITLHPPAYAGMPVTAADGFQRVLEGTGVEVTGTAKEPLEAARIRYGKATIDAEIRPDTTDGQRRAFDVGPEKFVAAKSGPYELELTNKDGIAGVAGQWNLNVEPDAPPSVAWQEPKSDLFVLPTAVIPINVVAKDNLAIASVALEFSRSDKPDAAATVIELYQGPPQAAPRDAAIGQQGESRSAVLSWSLADLESPIGTQLTLAATASDYRPGVGRTIAPRRITIIAREELDARIADRQTQIARRLEEAVAAERKTRTEVGGLAIQLRDAGQLSDRDKDALQTAELAQRRVSRMLADPSDGIPAQAKSLVDELRMNGLDANEAAQQLQALLSTLDRLAAGPLGTAEQELTAARKSAQSGGEQPAMEHSLATAGGAQDEVVRELEQSLADLTGWADLGRIVRDLAQLREDQLAYLEATRQEIGLATLPLELRELSRQQRASLNKASAGEESLARRYERMEAALDALAKSLEDGDSETAGRLTDALALARDRAIAGSMRETIRDLAANRIGQALVREADIGRAMEEVLDILRDRTQLSPENLIARLKAARGQLAALQNQLAKLKQDLAAAEKSPDAANQQRAQELRSRQQQLREQIARLAREMARLDAANASQSADQAAAKLEDQPPPNESQPADSRQAEQAERKLQDAAKQLAERQAQAEDDWAQKFLERFQTALTAMVADQTSVIASTTSLDQARANSLLTDSQSAAAEGLAAKERQLADDAHVHAELLAGLRVFGVALTAASQELNSAAEQLQVHDTGGPTQQAERRALERFEQIVWALEQTKAQAQQPKPPGPPGNAGGASPQPRPLFDLFEVKLLRMLQSDLNERTRQFQKRAALGGDQAVRNAEADQLSAEQTRLAKLAAELAARNNKGKADE